MTSIAYEYIFIGTYDDAVFNAGPVLDEELKNKVKDAADLNAHVLLYNAGIPSLSSMVDYNNNTYKVTVKRT